MIVPAMPPSITGRLTSSNGRPFHLSSDGSSGLVHSQETVWQGHKQTNMTIARRLKTTLEMIKIEHTLFALPFAFLEQRSRRVTFRTDGELLDIEALWITLAWLAHGRPR